VLIPLVPTAEQLLLKFAPPLNAINPAMSWVQPERLLMPFVKLTVSVGK
jgi:hypothetical protein